MNHGRRAGDGAPTLPAARRSLFGCPLTRMRDASPNHGRVGMQRLRIGHIASTMLALALALLPGTAPAQVVMRISISTPQDSHQGVAVDTLAREVARRSHGRFRIEAHYGGSLGDERQAIEAVQSGRQEMTWTSTGPLPLFVPEVGIFDVPFLLRDYRHARAVLDGPIGQEMLRKFEDKGLKALAWGENGFRHMTNNRRPIDSPEDLRGLRMRTMENPVHIQAFKGLGIVTVPMPFPEVYAALGAGRVDGQENPISVIRANHFERVQKYLTLTGHVYSPGVFLMNKAAYDRLGRADRKIFLTAARIAAQANRARVDADERDAVAYLRGQGMQVAAGVDRERFREALAPALADFERQFGKANLDRIRAVAGQAPGGH
ncbi:MAG: TRAP transporter substrate-binding protein DctP [Gallionellaceae bacterium]|nr:TRAP transporter substrate-binding protein DctP [Gallionellaceae bacterium]